MSREEGPALDYLNFGDNLDLEESGSNTGNRDEEAEHCGGSDEMGSSQN